MSEIIKSIADVRKVITDTIDNNFKDLRISPYIVQQNVEAAFFGCVKSFTYQYLGVSVYNNDNDINSWRLDQSGLLYKNMYKNGTHDRIYDMLQNFIIDEDVQSKLKQVESEAVEELKVEFIKQYKEIFKDLLQSKVYDVIDTHISELLSYDKDHPTHNEFISAVLSNILNDTNVENVVQDQLNDVIKVYSGR